jgi:hypothetical protein
LCGPNLTGRPGGHHPWCEQIIFPYSSDLLGKFCLCLVENLSSVNLLPAHSVVTYSDLKCPIEHPPLHSRTVVYEYPVAKIRHDARLPVRPNLLFSRDDDSPLVARRVRFQSNRRSEAPVTAVICVAHSLLPLFLRAPSFVFNHFQPLCPKIGGWVYPWHAFALQEALCLQQVLPRGRRCRRAICGLAWSSGASAGGAAFGGA